MKLIFDSNFTALVPKGPTNNKPALGQIMAWCQTGAKPILEPMMIQFTAIYMSNSASAVFKISAGPRTLTGKIWVGPTSFPSLSYINLGKIVLWSRKFQILF